MGHSYRGQFPGVGPKMIEKLQLIGVSSREELAQLGAVGAMDRYLSLSGGRKKYASCSCLTYSFEGIIRNCMWNLIPDETKKHLIAETHRLRAKYTQKK